MNVDNLNYLRVSECESRDGTWQGYAVVHNIGWHRIELARFPALPTIKLSRCYVRDYVGARRRAEEYLAKLQAEHSAQENTCVSLALA